MTICNYHRMVINAFKSNPKILTYKLVINVDSLDNHVKQCTNCKISNIDFLSCEVVTVCKAKIYRLQLAYIL